jgi:hypothetical protein
VPREMDAAALSQNAPTAERQSLPLRLGTRISKAMKTRQQEVCTRVLTCRHTISSDSKVPHYLEIASQLVALYNEACVEC